MRPIRCYTCGKVVGHLFTAWDSKVDAPILQNEEDRCKLRVEFFQEFNVTRLCCKRMFMCSVPDPNYDTTTVQIDIPPSISIAEKDDEGFITVVHFAR